MTNLPTPNLHFWATKAEAAEYARCSEVTIDRYLANGQLTLAGHAKKILIDLTELDALLRAKEPNEQAPGLAQK